MYHKNYQIFTQEVRTLEGVPSRVLDLQQLLINTELSLIWRPPNQPNGKIIRYEVILKIREFYGCKDLKLATPNNHIINVSTTDTMITIPDLRPYTSYSAQVVTHNSRHFSIIEERIFDTAQSEIPSETFSQLRVQDWKLMWNAPEDCSTITGSMIARIKIRGISIDKPSIPVITSTNETTISVIVPMIWKDEYDNISIFYGFDIKVVEIDTRRISTSEDLLYLRWQSPLPPLNGKLRDYGIQSCYNVSTYPTYHKEHCKIIANHFNTSCDLWDDYICKDVPITTSAIIQVFAYNVNVTEPGALTSVTEEMLVNIEPDAPGNCTFTINNNSVVDLMWFHPWKTGNRLRSFHVRVVETFSNLRKLSLQKPINESTQYMTYEYPVTQYMRNYSKQLYLYPSTKYLVYIQTVTVANRFSNSTTMEIYTPSTACFETDLNYTVRKSDSTILLNVPSVLNDTQGSMMHVIVKGPNPCDQHLKLSKNLQMQSELKMNETAWQVVEVSTRELAGKQFVIGDNKTYGNGKNCPLKSNKSYQVIIMITEQNSSNKPIILAKLIRIGEIPSMHHGVWFIPLTIYLVTASISYYLCRRKCHKSIEDQMQNEIACQNIQNAEDDNEYESIPSIRYSEQDLSSISEEQSLSNGIIPEELVCIIANDNEKEEEMKSLVKVKDFEDYVKRAIQSESLAKQYKMLSKGQTQPWNYGKLPQNELKNRYRNVIAYDSTRVILEKLPDNAYSDYINANYITGYKVDKRYIATQGPKPNTVLDFWRMVWQENVLIICMVTNIIENGRIKCEQYWPDIGKKKKYGDIIVLNAKHNIFADYCIRTFHVTCGEETRKIEHLHYTAWPDHGIPLYTHSIVIYLKKLLAISPGDGPVVVHCSAGIGRTGIIILCDICLRRAAAEKIIDVFSETASIISERANMINNTQQYILIHLILVECLFSIPVTLPCNEHLPVRIKELKEQLLIQQQRLQNIAWQDKVLRQVTPLPSLSERNRAKNRFPELISNMTNRIYLTRYPESDEDSDYFPAVYVDGVRLQNQYIATQLPMPLTLNDFWRMIAEFKIELILMLQPPDFQDFTCCAIAFSSGEFKPTPYLNITAREVVKMEYYTSQKLLLIDNSEKSSREQPVTILTLTEWKSGRNQSPPPVMVMVNFWQAAEKIIRSDGPIATLCHDGVTGCGLYLALSFLLERMAIERECDVCMAVRAVKRSRPDFVSSQEHLEYLYNAALTFFEYFESYANFS
ncbi:receptor-type tyrosine-protein phosphatase kappa-like [Pogonomyrmex barbatus]|uniref:protein-tyrosine-phosphatase n=1 Tax=Pogonomyrmex barbatus TaxID=144034 RepID=A0A6I9WPB2_9HYME|nr:receptor-type tyrosine-protein phosphatase kappa-like [Pogonomyrmex barbatus]